MGCQITKEAFQIISERFVMAKDDEKENEKDNSVDHLCGRLRMLIKTTQLLPTNSSQHCRSALVGSAAGSDVHSNRSVGR